MTLAIPSPSPSPSVVDRGAPWHAFWHQLWLTATASPVTAILFGGFVLLVIVRVVRAIAHPGHERDPMRRFSRQDKAELLRRAGGRCEWHGWLSGRCSGTERLEADHVHPHSRGGSTDLSNGQILCHRHNRAKRASIPFGWQLRAIAKRRAGYYPQDVSTLVVRRRKSDVRMTPSLPPAADRSARRKGRGSTNRP